MRSDIERADSAAKPQRFAGKNPDHHIWCNNGTYFIHLTLLWRGSRKLRVRKSLKTRDVLEARRRRDRFVASLATSSELTLLARTPALASD